jgi:hypothetical protein
VENVLAQGGLEYRRRLLIPEVAARLLELSERNSNAPLQGTCAMALAHMFSALTDWVGSTAPKSQRGVGDSPEQEQQASAIRVLGKVYEKCEGGIARIVDSLRDGDARVQQGLLTLLACIFGSLCDEIGEPDSGATVDSVFRQSRRFFVRSSQLLPVLMRIVEQGGSAVIRSKGLICLQLVSRIVGVSVLCSILTTQHSSFVATAQVC